jgi:fatty acid desaturase
MSLTKNTIESLLGKTEAYGKAELEIFKLKAVDKLAQLLPNLFSRMLFSIVFIFMMFFLNVGASYWIGELLGALYLGFLIVAGFYGLVSLLLLATHQTIVKRLRDRIISQLLN